MHLHYSLPRLSMTLLGDRNRARKLHAKLGGDWKMTSQVGLLAYLPA